MVFLRKSEHPLTTAIRNLLDETAPVNKAFCIALSGGMDSMALLSAALPLREEWQISVCHVNHGISWRADSWTDFCQEICKQAAVPLIVHRQTPPTGNVGEEWARNVRLNAFAALPTDMVLLAHHADDQAETVLFRLLRGAGAHGVAAMRSQTPLFGKTLLRPWLGIRRCIIADYAKSHKLRWIEDEDNRNLSRRRNFLRWRVMPVLTEAFPDYVAAFAASGRRMQDSAMLLSVLAKMDGDAAKTSGGLSVEFFRTLGEARTRNWLYYALLERRADASERYIAEVARQLLAADSRNALCFRFQTALLRCWRGALYWDAVVSPAPSTFHREVNLETAIMPFDELGGALVLSESRGRGLSPSLAGSRLLARLRCGGERLTPPRRPRRAVADLLREANIAPWHRARLPLLFCKGRLAAVPGVAVAAEFAATANETGLECRFEWRQ